MKQTVAIGKDYFLLLSKAGSTLNLSFSGYEVLNSLIMALDGINRKVLLMSCKEPAGEPVIIQLGETVNVSIKKSYARIPAGGLKSKSLEAFTDTISLEFELAGTEAAVTVPVFDAAINPPEERAKLEKKAHKWQQLLSKLSGGNNRRKLNDAIADT